MAALQIYDPGERRLVAAADRALSPCRRSARSGVRTSPAASAAAHPSAAPRAHRRSADGRCRRSPMFARSLPTRRSISSSAAGTCHSHGPYPAVDRVEPLDAPWLARGPSGQSLSQLLRQALSWRAAPVRPRDQLRAGHPQQSAARGAGAAFTAGFASGGGGALLDRALDYDPRAHTTDNARRWSPPSSARRAIGPLRGRLCDSRIRQRATAARRLPGSLSGPLIGVHVSGGRAIKQWDPSASREVARRLVDGVRRDDRADGQSGRSPRWSRPCRSALPRLSSHRRFRRRRPAHAGRDPRTARSARHRRHRPDAPGRRRRHAGRRHLRSVGSRAATRRAVRAIVSSASICRAARAIGSAFRRRAASGHTPDCLASVPVESVFEAAVSALTASGALGGVHAGPARARRVQ